MQSPTLSTHSSLSYTNERLNDNFICFNCNECIPIDDYLTHMSECSPNRIKKHISESSCCLLTKFTLETELTNDSSISNTNSMTMSSNKLTNTSSFDLDSSVSYLDEETFLLSNININHKPHQTHLFIFFSFKLFPINIFLTNLHLIVISYMCNLFSIITHKKTIFHFKI